MLARVIRNGIRMVQQFCKCLVHLKHPVKLNNIICFAKCAQMGEIPYFDILLSTLIFTIPRKKFADFFISLGNKFKRRGKGNKSIESAEEDSKNSEKMSQLDIDFRDACKAIQKAEFLSNQQSLDLYGLYKQAIMGDNIRPLPSKTDLIETKKW